MRLPDIPENALTPGQKEIVAEAIAGKRGQMSWTLRALIHSERFARHAGPLGEFFRYDTSLPPRLAELAILVTARYWTAQNEWHTHQAVARKVGLDPAIIDAIEGRKTPHFTNADEETIYVFAKTLHETKTVPADLYAKAQKLLGDQGLVELVGLLGYYTLVAMTLNTFDFGVPAGARPLV